MSAYSDFGSNILPPPPVNVDSAFTSYDEHCVLHEEPGFPGFPSAHDRAMEKLLQQGRRMEEDQRTWESMKAAFDGLEAKELAKELREKARRSADYEEKGLILKGVCNRFCGLHGEEQNVILGKGKFMLSKLKYGKKCRRCEAPLDPNDVTVNPLLFHNCSYKIEGHKKGATSISTITNGSCDATKYYLIDSIAKYAYLEVTTESKPMDCSIL